MARPLSQSVELLLACGVLHKQLTSENIVFFCTNEGDSDTSVRRDLTRPFITGFARARPHGSRYTSMESPVSDGTLHMHPANEHNVNQRYLKIFDVYSLGLILLQIGLWRPLHAIVEEFFPSKAYTLKKAGRAVQDLAGTSAKCPWFQERLGDWQEKMRQQQQHHQAEDRFESREPI